MTKIIGIETMTSPSRSLISWGAVFAGAFMAFVVLTILSTLGLAVGFTGDNSVGAGAAIWTVIAAIIALFSGGWVMSHSEVIFSRGDAAIHGVVLWGVLFFGLLLLAISGVQFGLNALTSVLGSFLGQVDPGQLAKVANDVGITQEQVQVLQQRMATLGISGAKSAWWTFISMIVTVGSVVWGAALGVPPGQAKIKSIGQVVQSV